MDFFSAESSTGETTLNLLESTLDPSIPDNSLKSSSGSTISDKLLETSPSSPSTLRARQADAGLFFKWCQERELTPLPASVGTVRSFIRAMLEIRALSTVRRYVSTISTLHREAGVENPVRSPEIKQVLRDAGRVKGSQVQRVRPIRRNTINKMLANDHGHLRDRRDLAMVTVAYDTLLRRTELANLDLEAIDFRDDGTAWVVLDFAGEEPGNIRHMDAKTVSLLKRWIADGAIHNGPLFRSIDKASRVGGRLSDRGVARAFQRLARQAGLDPAGISGLSCRVGAVQDMVGEGVEFDRVMAAGGWRSPIMVARYTRQQHGEHSPTA
ncbi:MAG: tyrosine-type recombinase/integrase [Magnetococcales bacterium]|nr:tyrosine-type recombinase/integrase [Magnetococcales bacterium]